VLFVEGKPRLPELRLGCVEAIGAAKRRAGDVDLMLKPDPGVRELLQEIARLDGVPPNMSVKIAIHHSRRRRFTAWMISLRLPTIIGDERKMAAYGA